MVKISHHGYLGICEVCQVVIPPGPGNKQRHYCEQHPELGFTIGRKGNKTRYGCKLCDRVHALPNYAAIVEHYNSWHPEVLQGRILLRPRNESNQKEEKLETDNPVATVNNFFAGLTTLMAEVEKLRAEKAEWMAVARKWAQQIVELQELLAKRP